MTENDDPLFWKPGEDREMTAAIESAQANFDSLLGALRSDLNIEEAFVKLMLPGKFHGVVAEHVYVSDLTLEGDTLFGVIDSDIMYTDEFDCGDRVPINRDCISDWMYVVDGIGTGGYTLQLMWSQFSDEERGEYKSEPPFCWLEIA
ncbi:MAG: DUF2314 domain-containing protein [Holophagales bacterium]|nr:DUF2314 domain-containing protein [Holophagales bacterium]